MLGGGGKANGRFHDFQRPLPHTLIEYYFKDDALGDPLIAEEHIACFGWANNEEMQDISSMAIRINDFMVGMFAAINIRLIDFKLEFNFFPFR